MESSTATEIQRCLESLAYILQFKTEAEAEHLLRTVMDQAHLLGLPIKVTNTPYINTIPADKQPEYPGDIELETRLQNIIQWNAMAMVVKANRENDGIGGHISSYASSVHLYEVAFNHFFRGYGKNHNADQVYFQGHASPGIYARAYVEGRLSAKHLHHFRQELADGGGLSSYPHPYLMPDFWQFPTVSMGLGPIMAIYQARFNRYLVARGILSQDDSRVWCFIGDGETGEPETLGALFMASREKLDNLIFVVNCNLQRLDGPVNGNGKIIQELESVFSGAGWNVIKLIWGSDWDPLLASEQKETLVKLLNETVDGQYQKYSVAPGSYTRKHFFGKYPELAELANQLTDQQILDMRRGGHDLNKIYAAYQAAVSHEGQPTVILAKTVKGYGLGEAGEGRNISHQQKKMNEKELRQFKKWLNIPLDEDEVANAPFYKPDPNSPEIQYLLKQREQLGGFLPERRTQKTEFALPDEAAFDSFFGDSGDSKMSTTMAFVRILTMLLKDKTIGRYIVPIVPDECRTFGMEALFRQIGIYASEGQKYEPVDRDSLLYYREASDGQMLEEGISEAGGMASFLASGTSYATHGVTTIPFYIYYSMFGFQRVGDMMWLAGDIRAKGFLLGGTAGRTTLNGEGLQHQDGHSHLIASTNPACVAYDPSFRFEIAVMIQQGMKRMYADNEDLFYYITVGNENYAMPARPDSASTDSIMRGLYKFKPASVAAKTPTGQAHLLGSGAIMPSVLDAQSVLESEYGIPTHVWSVTSYQQLRRDALDVERRNRLNPEAEPETPYVQRCFEHETGVFIAASDNMKVVSDQISAWVPGGLTSLGTDGFGRSDTREQLRRFFEVDTGFIVYTTVYTLYRRGDVSVDLVKKAMAQYAIDPNKTYGRTVI
jgi:pyruvate dehydrogenase E1 component